jgi:hypothetical protein
MTKEMFKQLQLKDPRYQVYVYEDIFGNVVAEKLCVNLGKPLSAYRRECSLGYTNPDGIPGVKTCCDCGTGNCTDYVAVD